MSRKLIIKRDGTKQLFDKMKIVDAVLAAFEEVDGEITAYAEIKAGNIADYIAEKAEEKELDIEEIQDLVERGLMSTRRKDVARAYIVYRENRTRERNKNNALIKTVGEKLMAKNVQNSNANVDELSFGGRRGEAADAGVHSACRHERIRLDGLRDARLRPRPRRVLHAGAPD